MSKYVSFGMSTVRQYGTKEHWLEDGSINTSSTETSQEDVEKIKEALNLLGMDLWEIRTENFGGDLIEKSPLILEWEARKKTNREEYTKKMNALVEEYNKLPEIPHRWTFGNVEILLRRGIGEYKPGHSLSMISWIHTEAYRDGRTYPLSISSYVTSDGKLKRKLFMENHSNLPILIAVDILKAIPAILKARSDIIRKYNIR